MFHGVRNVTIRVIAGILFGVVAPHPANTAVLHVKQDAGGAADGTTWENAFPDFQSALDAAEPGDEIWVAAGTYRPTARTEPDDPRSATFSLRDEVGVFGGFAGTELFRDQRDPVLNKCILSGDVNSNDAPGVSVDLLLDEASRMDNTYHVVTAHDVTNTAVLDGFTVAHGHADGPLDVELSVWHPHGGGLLIIEAKPTIRNVDFVRNVARRFGSALMLLGSSSPILEHCYLAMNAAGRGGQW